MRNETEVRIEAPTDAVWAVMADVERWPEWTDTMRDVRLLEDGGLRVGARVRIEQPRLPTVTWRVDAVTPGQGFSWVAGPRAGRSTGFHDVHDDGAGGSRVVLALEQSGISAVFGRFTASLTRDYLAREAAGLKRRVEGP